MLAIQKNIQLQPYNTFGINAIASNFIEVCDIDTLKEIILNYKQNYDQLFILGGGSNILFTKDVEGLTIKNNIKGINIVHVNETEIELEVKSGTIWHDLVTYAVDNGYQGIENLALIPGTVGAAPMQNIGAYGVEICDVLTSVHAINLFDGKSKIFNNKDCKFGYRESIFKNFEKNKYFIYSINILLKKKDYNLSIEYGDIKNILLKNRITDIAIKDIYNAVIEIRSSKLPNPKELGNAGSFFKNPEIDNALLQKLLLQFPNMPHYLLENGNYKIPAAWLIEQSDFKGKIIENTGNHTKQALVIVNYGNASGDEILNHAYHVINVVLDKFEIHLTPEVNIL